MGAVRVNPQNAATSRLWVGSTGANTYVDVPVTNLSAQYRRQGLLVFVVHNGDGNGGLYYIGITNDGEIATVKTVFSSESGVSVTASTNKQTNTVRVNTPTFWSMVFVISDLALP